MDLISSWAMRMAGEVAPDEVDLAPIMADAFVRGGKDRKDLFRRPKDAVPGAFGPEFGVTLLPQILAAIQDMGPTLLEENLPETKDVPAAFKKHTREEHVSNEQFRTNVLLRSEQTNDQVSVIENLVPAGWGGPPLHHHDFDETFYVLEGELTFQLGDEIFTRTQGELAFAPRGTHHTLANPSRAAAHYLLVCTPAGFERRFDLMAAEQAGIEPPPETVKPIPETIFVGPRIGERRAVEP